MSGTSFPLQRDCDRDTDGMTGSLSGPGPGHNIPRTSSANRSRGSILSSTNTTSSHPNPPRSLHTGSRASSRDIPASAPGASSATSCLDSNPRINTQHSPPRRHHIPPAPVPTSAFTPTRTLRHQRSASLPQRRQQQHTASRDTDTHLGRVRSMSVNGRKATLKIDFLIVGGGIAGLACAYALSQSGHRVRVLEKAKGLGQRSGGIRVPPNLTKILIEWGLGDELAKTAQRCRKSAFHSLETGENVGYLEWKDDVIQETGGDFLLMHFDDLHRMLYNLALSVGATVTFDAVVSSVSVDEATDTPSVMLADGTLITADVVIGADGHKSIVKDVITGTKDDGIESGQSFYTIVVPADMMRADPELAHLPDLPEWPIWMGDSRSVLGYPVRGGKEYCVHIYWPDNEIEITNDQEDEEGWDVVYSTDVINLDGYDNRLASRIRRLFKMAPDALRTKYITRNPLEDWVDETGRLVLIGEAAHPLLPCGTHSASLSVEDAAVMGVLMSRLRTYDQVPMLMEAFQDLRQTRCTNVHHSELNNAALVTLPPGPIRDGRDAGMKQAMLSSQSAEDRWDDAQLREQWEEIAEVFGYNAREAAEDWWVNWGALGERSKAMPVHEPLDLRFEITETKASAPSTWTRVMG